MHIQSHTDSHQKHPPSYIERSEVALSVVVTALMMALPIVAALYRAGTHKTLTGTIVFVQHLTLWAAFLGALLASKHNKHLSLATSQFIHDPKLQKATQFFAHTLCALANGLLAYGTCIMIESDQHTDSRLFELIPVWWGELIMPISLALMAIRSAYFAHTKKWTRILISVLALLPAGFWLFNHVDFFVSFPWHGTINAFLEHQPFTPLRWPSVIALLCALILGAPIYIGMIGMAMIFFYTDNTPIATIPIEMLRLVESPTLPAIPLLTLCGFILAEGGASSRLMRVAKSIVGFLPGGVAIVVILVCAFFTALTGGSGVTIIALGGLVLPLLVKEGYSESFALGLVSAAGSLGLLLPPSLPVILYSVVAELPAQKIFDAAILPSILLIVLVLAYSIIHSFYYRTSGSKNITQFSIQEISNALWDAKWYALFPVIFDLGLYRGKTTIVETAAMAALYAIITESIIYRDLVWNKKLVTTIAESSALMGSVLIVLGSAMGLTSYLVDAQIPTALVHWVTAHIHSKTLFLLTLNCMLLVLGSVLEIFSAIVILAPLIVPLGKAFEIETMHLGIIFLANLELGFLFPPIGLNLLLSSSRFRQPLTRVYRSCLPFLLIIGVGLMIITYCPSLIIYSQKIFGSR